MAASVEAYLANLPPGQRAALERLRDLIRTTAPGAVESVNYGVPAFKLDGRPLVSYGAARVHCTFYVQSTAVTEAHASELRDFRLGKGSVQFQPDRPIPGGLVRKLVQARIAENAERFGKR